MNDKTLIYRKKNWALTQKDLDEMRDDLCEYVLANEQVDFENEEDLERVIEMGSSHIYYKALVVFHEGNMEDVHDDIHELIDENEEDEE